MALAPFGRTLIPRMRQLHCQRRYARLLAERWQAALPGRALPALATLPLSVQPAGENAPVSLLAAAEHTARLRLAGLPGTGRSLAVRQLLLAWANGDTHLACTPVYIHLPTTSLDPDAAFRAELQTVGFDTDPIVIERGFASGLWMPVLDDCDSAPEIRQLVWRKWLLHLTSRYPVLRALVVTDPEAGDWPEFGEVAMSPVTPAVLERWLAHLLPGEEPELLLGPLLTDERLRPLGERLLDIVALALTYERNGFPPNRARLYATTLDFILRPLAGPELPRVRTSLAALGFQALAGAPPPPLPAELRAVAEQLGGLVAVDQDQRLHFAHPAFLAFCAALYLATGGKLAGFDPAAPLWLQTLPMAAGLVADPEALYSAIRGPGRPDRQRTLLLAACLREHRAPLPGWSAAILGGLARLLAQGEAEAGALLDDLGDVVSATIAQQLMEGAAGERWAVALLRLLSPPMAIPHLIELVGDSRLQRSTRRVAALHLAGLPESALIKPLTQLAERSLDDLGRSLATSLLSRTGPVGRRYLAQLVRAGRMVFAPPADAADRRELVATVAALLDDAGLDQATHTAATVALRGGATSETLPLLIQGCQSPSAALREAARRAIAGLEPPLVLRALASLIIDPAVAWPARSEALQMLQNTPGPAITAVLARLLTSSVPLAARLEIAAHLLGRSPKAAERLLATLEHPALGPGARAALVASFDRPMAERALPLLLRFSQSAPAPLRASAIRALAERRGDEQLAMLAGIVEREREDLAALVAAIEALGASGDESAILALRSVILAPLEQRFRADWERAAGREQSLQPPAAWLAAGLPEPYQLRWGIAMAEGSTGADAPTSLAELVTRETHLARTAAVRGLRAIGGPVANQVLREALLATTPVVAAGAPPWPEFGLEEASLGGVAELVYALETMQPPAVRWAAARSLQHVTAQPSPPLQAPLEIEPRTRSAMLREIGGDLAIIPMLEALIVDQTAPLSLRMDAVAALGRGGAPHAEGLLLAVLSSARDLPLLQVAALDALPPPLSSATLGTIRQLLRDTRPRPEVGAAALRCLARVGDRESLALFLRFAQHDQPALAIAAIEGLATLNDSSSTPMLHRLAQTGPLQIRLHAVGALLSMEGNTHLPLLRSSLETGSLPTRMLALELLIDNLARPAEALLAYVDASWPLPLRLRTAQVLAASPTAASLEALAALLESAGEVLALRCLAADAVCAARYSPALEAIEAIAQADHAPLALRRRAIGGLRHWRREAGPALLLSALAEDDRPWIRTWAVDALTGAADA